MLFTTPTQFAALALVLLAGWLFGLASAPGGKKWKQRYRDEETARIAAERELRELRLEHERLRKHAVVSDTATAADVREERRRSILPTIGGAAAGTALPRETRDERDLPVDRDRGTIAPQSAARPAHDPVRR